MLRDIARVHGMTRLARETGLNCESLYKSLSRDGNPSFETMIKIVKDLGLKMAVAVQPS
ncbi:Predicted transcriptional regulator [Mobiluncus mulieris]|uniref:addiction module antidote protein n=1 Tax=Mobiluncus mulieris TaxID=2052 RepID=UPI00019F9730|nr:addiction module antidote protein [Mobiluncus mulieris]EEJ53990.1 putative addiction module antidote protein [Mobiluncus mulieris ATCC 35243]SPX71264.1 Predicted transcriptional regulator [Mobiluncus mulieris]